MQTMKRQKTFALHLHWIYLVGLCAYQLVIYMYLFNRASVM